jgi:hypothetical protein
MPDFSFASTSVIKGVILPNAFLKISVFLQDRFAVFLGHSDHLGKVRSVALPCHSSVRRRDKEKVCAPS